MDSWKRIVLVLLGAAAFASAAGCGDDGADDGADAGPLEIAGDYTDDWGGEHHIADDSWSSTYAGEGDAGPTTSTADILEYDNDDDYLVSLQDALFGRYDWTYSGADLYYCQIEYAAADEETAAANESADRADLAAGCGGFGWTHLTPM